MHVAFSPILKTLGSKIFVLLKSIQSIREILNIVWFGVAKGPQNMHWPGASNSFNLSLIISHILVIMFLCREDNIKTFLNSPLQQENFYFEIFDPN